MLWTVNGTRTARGVTCIIDGAANDADALAEAARRYPNCAWKDVPKSEMGRHGAEPSLIALRQCAGTYTELPTEALLVKADSERAALAQAHDYRPDVQWTTARAHA